MKAVDRKKFFESYRKAFGRLTQAQVDALESLLSFLEADEEIKDPRWAAYMLATVKHETAGTFRPIEEYGRGKGMKYGEPHPKTGLVYYGRGLTQNTWYDNYLALTQAWNKLHPDRPLDFTLNPDLLLELEYSYWAMSYGMRTGLYTGKRLSQYINDGTCNYRLARKIINSQDQAERIEKMARLFETILIGAE